MTVKFFVDITLSRMKKFLHFDLVKKIKDCLTGDSGLNGKFQSFQDAFSAAVEREDKALLQSRKSLLTPEIQQLDVVRIAQYKSLRSAVRELRKLPDLALSTAADFVWSLFKTHGDIPDMRVNERTGALTNLSQDLTEKYAPQVEAIGLTQAATNLATANADYIRLYDQRLHEWSEFTTEEVQNARKESDETLENLFIMVASGILTEGMAPFKHFVDFSNEAIKKAKIAMGTSAGKPDGEEAGDGEETDDPGSGGGGTDTDSDNTGSDNGNQGGSGDNNGGSTGGDNGGNNGGYPPGYDPDADDDPGV